MLELVATVWLCIQVVSPEGTLLVGHHPAYQWGVQVATSSATMGSVGECMYYKLAATCEQVHDYHDPQFRTTYLCEVTND